MKKRRERSDNDTTKAQRAAKARGNAAGVLRETLLNAAEARALDWLVAAVGGTRAGLVRTLIVEEARRRGMPDEA